MNIVLTIYLDKYWLYLLKYLLLKQSWFGKIRKCKKPSNFILREVGSTCTDSCLETAKISQVVLLVEWKGVWSAGNRYHLLKEMDFYKCG